MNDKVSIIMPCYKAEKYIADTLNDILNQTYTNWELIAVSNGAGQEPQLKILKEFQQKDSLNRIRIITEEKGSEAIGRNIGMGAATGKWLTYIDADDRVDPTHIQLFMDVVANDDADIVIGGFTLVRKKEGTSTVMDIKSGESLMTKKELCNLSSTVMNGMWNKLYRTEFVQHSGIAFKSVYTRGTDSVYNRELLLKARKIKTIPLTGYKYICFDEGSAMSGYHACYEELRKTEDTLLAALMRQAGYTESEIAERLRKGKFIDGYFFVCNLFKKGSPLHFGEKRSAIKRYVFDDAEMRSAIASEDRTKHNLFLKIYDFALAFHSPTMMTIIFQAQYTLKYNLMPLYLKIAPRLRK